MAQIRDYLHQAHSRSRDGFVSSHPEAVLVQSSAEPSGDPRNEYRSTLRMRIDSESQDIKVEPLPPSPLDAVFALVESDRKSFAGKVLVGRTETNDIVISHLTVSKHHAYFRHDKDAGRMSLCDTGSTNGTRVNGQTLQERQPRYLADGDRIAFGDVQFVFFTASGFYDLLQSLSVLL
ncbi:MAG: FHA domain-containing protein [Deltaproteobacteria bacterium]|nr:FHA domain-containing protein [Deltaproteobacteria bacterium]